MNICKKHLKDNILIYIFLSLVFIVGISAGAITINMVDAGQKKGLVTFLDSFIKVINGKDVNNVMLIKQSFKNNLQTFALLWFLGVTIIGIPLVIGLVALRGFILGFTVGFIVRELGFKGFMLSAFAVIPQNIIFIPWIIASGAIALMFSVRFIKNKLGKNIKGSYVNDLIMYTLMMGILFLTSLSGSIIEAYITPVLMKIVS